MRPDYELKFKSQITVRLKSLIIGSFCEESNDVEELCCVTLRVC